MASLPQPTRKSEPFNRFVRAFLGLVRTRFELFEVEFQEEKFRAINLLVWFAAAIALGVAGILILTGLLGVFLFRIGGYGALGGLGGALLVSAGVIVWLAQRRLHHGALPFAESINELKKDVQWLNLKD